METQTLVGEKEVLDFLHKHYDSEILDLKYLSKGKHSTAFCYKFSGKDFVARFNTSPRGFLKDKYAYNNFSTHEIIIPKIYEIGELNKDVFFCISEKISGETIKSQYAQENFSSLPMQFEMIERIKNIAIADEHKYFGEWNPDNSNWYASTQEYIKSYYLTKDFFDWEELSKILYFDKNFVEYLVNRISHFLNYAGAEHSLMHGDFGNDNVLIHDGIISGIIDWERFRYADHFLDVGRVVLYCPSREEAVDAVLNFYKI